MDRFDHLIRQVNDGVAGARDQLFEMAYPELRKLARSRLRHGGRSTYLDTTALVNETYLRCLHGGSLHLEHRRAFYSYASRAMRSVIVDAVRVRRADRRGGGLERKTLDTQVEDAVPDGHADVLRVHESLSALADAEPRLARVVEMRYFGGYSEAEIGLALDLSERQVRRDWDRARRLLALLLAD